MPNPDTTLWLFEITQINSPFSHFIFVARKEDVDRLLLCFQAGGKLLEFLPAFNVVFLYHSC